MVQWRPGRGETVSRLGFWTPWDQEPAAKEVAARLSLNWAGAETEAPRALGQPGARLHLPPPCLPLLSRQNLLPRFKAGSDLRAPGRALRCSGQHTRARLASVSQDRRCKEARPQRRSLTLCPYPSQPASCGLLSSLFLRPCLVGSGVGDGQEGFVGTKGR